MKLKNRLGFCILVLTIIGMSTLFADATISSLIQGPPMVITELVGSVEYSVTPFTSWGATVQQAGATWRARVKDLTVDFTGDMNLTWTLYDAGIDNLVGTGDDSIIPGATFVQTEAMVGGVAQNITSSSDGFNPYNWGQWTSTPMTVYIQVEVTEG